MSQIIAYCDGGSRGNPGPSACAFAVYNGTNLLHSEAFYLGDDKTNNEAEYAGIIKLLEWLHGKTQRVLIFCDSTLVVNQVNGNWDVTKTHLLPLHARATGFKIKDRHTLQYCKGHDGIIGNELCDELVNRCLDEHTQNQTAG